MCDAIWLVSTNKMHHDSNTREIPNETLDVTPPPGADETPGRRRCSDVMVWMENAERRISQATYNHTDCTHNFDVAKHSTAKQFREESN